MFAYDWEGHQPEAVPFYDFFNFNFLHCIRPTTTAADVYAHMVDLALAWNPSVDRHIVWRCFVAYLVDHALRRFRNSQLPRDPRSTQVLHMIGECVDMRSHWIRAY